MAKNNKYYHTSVDIKEYEFEYVTCKVTSDIRKLIRKFNASKDKNEKTKIAEQLPISIFPICRFCGKLIINSNFKLIANVKNTAIKLHKPQIWCREINDNKYYLSCCEDCLFEHFKDDPPKSAKYYFMKANKYGMYEFGYSEEEYRKICSMCTGVTEKSMKKKWGDEIGLKKWQEYCNKQSINNTFEYKKENYGWNEIDFKKFNLSRAVTKENQIKKYGEIDGLNRWNKYVERQRYTMTLDYFIEKHGEINGKQKYIEFSQSRVQGGINAQTTQGYSNISQELFDEIRKNISVTDEIYYEKLNNEYIVICDETHLYRVDFYDKTKNIIIEFYGDYWHANPLTYDKDNLFIRNDYKITSQEIWNYDMQREILIKKSLNNPIFKIVWEHEYIDDKLKIIDECTNILNNN